jgi:hypothetical protein
MSEITISAVFGGLFSVLFLFFTGFCFGRRFFKTIAEPYRSVLGSGITVALLSIFGSILYYLAPVHVGGLVGILITVFLLALPSFKTPERSASGPMHWPAPATIIAFLAGLISLGVWWALLITHPITESVRSPWLVLSPGYLVFLFVPIVLAIVLVGGSKTRLYGAALFALSLFSALAMAAALYPLGYGFDPFLHRATVAHIAEFGTITPKPLYYIGQYALELFGTKIFQLPLNGFDAYLAPILASLFISAAVFGTKKSYLALIFLPIGAFVQTTPQALAFVFTVLTIFLAEKSFKGATIFSIAALFAHPLAGIPALLYLVLVKTKDSPPLTVVITGISSIILPLAFAVQAAKAHLPLNLSLPNAQTFAHFLNTLTPFFGTNFNAFGDVAYFFIGNAFLIVVILAIVAAVQTYRSGQRPDPTAALSAFGAFMNFAILSLFFNFDYLISYERSDFAIRALTLTTIFLLPYVADIRTRFVSVGTGLKPAPTAFIVLLGIIFVANVYGAYPRHDNYVRSAGFNVEPSDIEAVKAMEAYSGGRDYVVLSNQATAAAAVQEFGFKKYYPGDIFYYPIPTGGKLYNEFLLMSETPSLEIIADVRALTGSDVVYFVVSDYWWKAEEIRENTKTIADHSFTLGDGRTTVFVFESL